LQNKSYFQILRTRLVFGRLSLKIMTKELDIIDTKTVSTEIDNDTVETGFSVTTCSRDSADLDPFKDFVQTEGVKHNSKTVFQSKDAAVSTLSVVIKTENLSHARQISKQELRQLLDRLMAIE
jgi:hypothetical protein